MEIENKDLEYWKGRIAETYGLLGGFLKKGAGYGLKHLIDFEEKEGKRPLAYYLYVSNGGRLCIAAQDCYENTIYYDKDLEEVQDPRLLELALSDVYGLLEQHRSHALLRLTMLQTTCALAQEAQDRWEGGLSPEESHQRQCGLIKQINDAGFCAAQFV
jgi:hypothetical protein